MFVYRVFLEESLADLWRCGIIREEEEEERISSTRGTGGMNINVDDDDVDMLVMMICVVAYAQPCASLAFFRRLGDSGTWEV